METKHGVRNVFAVDGFISNNEPRHEISNNLTSVDADEPLRPPFRLRNSKWCSVSSLTIIEYSNDKQRL